MTATIANPRVTVVDGWVVRDLPSGDQVRARLVHGTDALEPERGRGTCAEGVSLVRFRDGYGGVDLDEHQGLATVLERVWHDGPVWKVSRDDRTYDPAKGWAGSDRVLGDEDAMVEFVRRYLRAFWDVQYIDLHHSVGYSQGDWADVWVIAEGIEDVDPDALARSVWDMWDDWAIGDVYAVEVETRTLADAMEASGAEDGWASDEFVSGYYGDTFARQEVAEALSVSVEDVPAAYDIMHYDY